MQITVELLKFPIFWDIMPYSPLKFNRRFGTIYHHHFQVQRISQARNQNEDGFFDPEDGGDMFLRNVS
jgi:hypothetical protein